MAGASVGLVIARAQVSRRAFYECFANLEDATVAVMDGALEQLSALASQALAAEESWRDGMRAALAAVLEFFDSNPELARVCVVEALGGGPVVLARREHIVSAFRALVVASIERQVTPASPLAAEGVMASVMGIVHTHIVTEQSGPLLGLLGPLMGLASSLYLDGGEVQREIERGNGSLERCSGVRHRHRRTATPMCVSTFPTCCWASEHTARGCVCRMWPSRASGASVPRASRWRWVSGLLIAGRSWERSGSSLH